MKKVGEDNGLCEPEEYRSLTGAQQIQGKGDDEKIPYSNSDGSCDGVHSGLCLCEGPHRPYTDRLKRAEPHLRNTLPRPIPSQRTGVT